MSDEQKETLRHFFNRPLMYIPNLDKKQIIAFVHGLETGDKNLRLTNEISELLETREKIKKVALGWPYQVEKYAERQNSSWFDALKLLTMEIVNK